MEKMLLCVVFSAVMCVGQKCHAVEQELSAEERLNDIALRWQREIPATKSMYIYAAASAGFGALGGLIGVIKHKNLDQYIEIPIGIGRIVQHGRQTDIGQIGVHITMPYKTIVSLCVIAGAVAGIKACSQWYQRSKQKEVFLAQARDVLASCHDLDSNKLTFAARKLVALAKN